MIHKMCMSVMYNNMKGELGGTGCCGGSHISVAMATSVRPPGFESLSCRFSPFSPFFVEQVELQ